MATREEIIEGLQFTVTQGRRTTALYAEGEWDWVRASGWTPRQTYSHLAAAAGLVPGVTQTMMAASEDADLLADMDVNAMNDQAVAGMASMTPEQVMQAFETNYGKLIEFVKAVPDDLLNSKRRMLSELIPVSDILANVVMLHGIYHVYQANSRFESPL